MPLTQKIGKVKYFINHKHKVLDAKTIENIYSLFEKRFDEFIARSEYKEALYFESVCQRNGDLIINMDVSILYNGIFQTEVNYSYIHPYLKELIYKLTNIYLDEKDNLYKLTVMKSEFVSMDEIFYLLERSEAHILKNKNNNKFTLYDDVDSLLEKLNKTVNDNYYFINCHRNTDFHEIDPKIIEARLCLAYGLANSSISLMCITLEETLKTLLKYNYIHNNQDNETKPSLKEVKELSNKAQRKYGSSSLGDCIKAIHKEGLIDDNEKTQLNRINNYLRNAHIHSDKSKMFAKNKSTVKLVGIEEGKLKIVDEAELSMHDLIYAQGYMQAVLAEKNARKIFYEIEDLIYTLTRRYWQNNREFMDEITAT